MTRPRLLIAAAAGLALILSACSSEAEPTPTGSTSTPQAAATATTAPAETPAETATEAPSSPTAPPATPVAACDALDPVLAEASFVLVTSAVAGQPLAAGDTIEGCSRTFESQVDWMLEDREGNVVASGFTMGGGVDGAGAFTFVLDAYTVAEPQVGHLVVAAPDPSGGEGFPPSTHRIPVVLLP
ncbi:MAG: hypothetical protein AMXMBFR23_05040 [Chloroflexota bacterium]